MFKCMCVGIYTLLLTQQQIQILCNMQYNNCINARRHIQTSIHIRQHMKVKIIHKIYVRIFINTNIKITPITSGYE